MGFFETAQLNKDLILRLSEVVGGPYADPFNEIGIIVSVADPKNLGRVQVEYSGFTDWAYVQGSSKGRLSTQFIGAPCLIAKSGGNSSDIFVVQIFNKEPSGPGLSTPLQVSVLDEQAGSTNAFSDPGMQCNENNVGRLYLFENEITQDLAICLRRNNTQENTEPTYSWKSLTHGKLVEKGFDTGVVEAPERLNLSSKVGIPKCSIALEGEIREFTEDRKFRSTMMVCRRDENGDFSWVPLSTPPVVFRTYLPSCTEKNHGMTTVIDPGDNSELAICLRYQGQMKWVHPGSRRPVQFYPSAPPPKRDDVNASKLPIEELKKESTETSSKLPKEVATSGLNSVPNNIPPISSDPRLDQAFLDAGFPITASSFEKIYRDVVSASASASSGVAPEIIEGLLVESSKNQAISPELESILSTLGTSVDPIIQAIKTGDVETAIETVGKQIIQEGMSYLPPEVASVYTGYIAGGAVGAIDAAALVGLSQLPPEIASAVQPVWDLGKDILNSQPVSVTNVIGSAVGAIDQYLPESVNQIISSAGGVENIIGLTTSLASGDLGQIAQAISGFSGIPGLPTLPGGGSIPSLASAALQVVGLGVPYVSLLGVAGLGLTGFSELTGLSPITTLLGGIPGLGGLFSGGTAECPCDPKCRKTEHGYDSDGNKLLDPCGNVIKSGSSSYSPSGNPLENNDNPITDFLPTGIGSDLCVPNPFDLTAILKAVSRLRDLADRMEGAKYADFPEFFEELVYSLEAIEKALKQADNNITKIESIERKLIDSHYRHLEDFFSEKLSVIPLLMDDVRENAKAIRDLHKFTKTLNKIKQGGIDPVIPVGTPEILASNLNIETLPVLKKQARTLAKAIKDKSLKLAHKEWKELTPGEGLLELGDIVLGLFNPDVPINFDKCKTKRTEEKVLKDSLESKLNSPVPPSPSSLVEALIPTEYSPTPIQPISSAPVPTPTNEEIATILDQITYEQGRATEGEANC